ncbi:hypothetical protein RSOLAG1IB_04658 [Rhizoctonia solani AG-1 IB]|uniref:Uncharacterized protein n=2 Tax=Thanatephorus cucumeris (strain AG1-IB / isolate 7/3/14) TaxID=1108050 RepID=A0A0B7G070_THACB|nr:hypothetical protein RSOLAG1IB_04658 [Rhizoctonia solani AG-1 IB]
MISPDDTMAARLWFTHLDYTNTSRSERKQTALNSVSRPVSPIGKSSSQDDNDEDTSELPYLCTEPAEAKGIGFIDLPSGDSFGSEIDSAALMAMLSGVNETAVEVTEHRGYSRPVLHITPISATGNMARSTPSPVDSGYGSRPDTPLTDACGGYGSDESAWSPVDDTSSISDDSSNTHTLLSQFSDEKYWHHVTDAKAAIPAPQGPIIPRIVLSDEEGRVVEFSFNNLSGGISQPVDQDADSPYGGLMFLAAPEHVGSVSPTVYAPATSNIRNSAFGAVLDRAFVSPIRPRTTTTPLTAAPIYHYRHRASTFVLNCVGEGKEEEQGGEVNEQDMHTGALDALSVRKGGNEKYVELKVEVDLGRVMGSERRSAIETSVRDVEWAVNSLTGDECDASQDSMLTEAQPACSSAPTLASRRENEFQTWCFEDEEDEECEECGLFLTEPDSNYSRLIDDLCKQPCEPAVVIGLLKTVARSLPVNKDLNTAYHVTVQGRVRRTDNVSCPYDCGRGHWNNSVEASFMTCPQDCPVHGGRDACGVGAIFHRSATFPLVPILELESVNAGLDYQTSAIEIVGLPPLGIELAEEDLDDSDLVLHRGEKLRPTENKNIAPKAGASYDDYMSRFMDDVDLSSNNSNDNIKNAPFGRLVGGGLKDMTVPEAVDHLKEGLEKTENVFRVALTAPFRFNSVADKLSQHLKSADQKVQPPKERRGSNAAFCHHRKRSSTSGIKTKWSNMLNKFMR